MENLTVRCCTPLTREPLDAERAAQLATAFKALADPVRLRLFSLIASHADGEACVCDLTGEFDVSQPTISHHLKVLREAGLLTSQRRASWVYYRVAADALAALATLLAAPGTPGRTAAAVTRGARKQPRPAAGAPARAGAARTAKGSV